MRLLEDLHDVDLAAALAALGDVRARGVGLQLDLVRVRVRVKGLGSRV